MTAFDLSPLFQSTVGFDHLGHLLDTATRVNETAQAYPPYNIEKLGENNYSITLAVAGFSESDLEIVAQDHSLVISGKSGNENTVVQYLHRGIAGRSFTRRFELADFIRVANASLVDGLLHVDLVREVPEAMKPHTITIGTKAIPQALSEKKKAA